MNPSNLFLPRWSWVCNPLFQPWSLSWGRIRYVYQASTHKEFFFESINRSSCFFSIIFPSSLCSLSSTLNSWVMLFETSFWFGNMILVLSLNSGIPQSWARSSLIRFIPEPESNMATVSLTSPVDGIFIRYLTLMKILGIDPRGVFMKESLFTGFPILFIGNRSLCFLVPFYSSYQYVCCD